MKFITLQENFKKGLSIVGHASIKNINLPILNNVLIKVKKNEVQLVSTNLEIGIVHKLRGKVEKEGEFTVDSKIIYEYINLLPEEKIKIEEKSGELIIECNNYKTKIKGESAKEFPLIPSIEKGAYCSLGVGEFRNALSKVAFAATTADNRPELAGVFFIFQEKTLTLVATDSYRLAEKILNITKSDFIDQKIIVPIKTIQELLRILNNININDQEIDKVNEIKIYLSDNQLLFTIDSIDLISRLVSGHYPDYKQIIPNKYSSTIKINRQELIRAVKATALFSRAGINDISLVFKNNQALISSFSSQSGESSVYLKGEQIGPDLEITINYRYLLDGLNNLSSEFVVFKLNDSQSPCVLRADQGEDYLYIVMPIRQ